MVVVMVGVEDRSNETPEEEVTVAGEEESGTGAVVRQQVKGWETICLRAPPLLATMITFGARRPFLTQSVTSHLHTALILAIDVKPSTSWGTCTSIARGESTKDIRCPSEPRHRARPIPSLVAVLPLSSRSTTRIHGSTRTSKRILPFRPRLALATNMLLLRTD